MPAKDGYWNGAVRVGKMSVTHHAFFSANDLETTCGPMVTTLPLTALKSGRRNDVSTINPPSKNDPRTEIQYHEFAQLGLFADATRKTETIREPRKIFARLPKRARVLRRRPELCFGSGNPCRDRRGDAMVDSGVRHGRDYWVILKVQ